LTITAGTGTATFTGAVGGTTAPTNFTFASAALIQIGNNITVSGANTLTFPDPVSLTGTSTITTNNASLSFGSTLNGAQALTIAGGSGTTTFTGAVGGTTPLSSLSATAATVTQSSTAKTTGALSYTGSTAINVSGNVTTSGGVITMTGPVTASGSPTFDSTNAGGTAAGANISFSSTLNGATALTFRAGTAGNVIFSGAVGGTSAPTNLSFTSANQIQIGSNVTVSGANPLVFSSPVSFTGTSTVTTNNANLTFSSTLDGAQTIGLVAGSGSVTFTGAVGGTTPPTSLTISSANNVTANALTAVAFAQSAGSGTTTFNGAVSISGASGLALTGTNFTFNNTATLTSTAPATITQSGTLTLSSGANISLASGSFTQNGAGTNTLAANVTSTSGSISFLSPITLTGAVTLQNTSGGSITLSGTVDGAQTFNLSSPNTITLSSAVGATTALTSLTASGATVTQGATAKTTGAINYTGSSAINLGGNLTTSGNAIHLLTGPVTLNANVALDTTNAGGTPAGAGITVSSNVSQGSTQSLTVNGGTTGVVSIGGNLAANAFTVTNSAGTTITGTTTVPTVTLTNTTGNITFNGAATISTALTTAAQGYGVIFNNGGTVTPAASFLNTGGVTLQSGSSASLTFANGLTSTASSTTLLGTIKTTVNGAAMSFGAATFSSGNSTVSTPSGTIGFGSTVTLTGNATVDSTNGGGSPAGAAITFSGPVNGPGNLTVIAGTSGDISFVGAVGAAPQVNVLTISSARNVTANAITASSIVQSAGAGTTTFNGAINTNGAAGITLTGTNFAVNANITTTNGGPFTINHSGTYTIAPTATLNISGQYTDNGTGGGSTDLSGTIITNGTNISFSNPVLLVGTASLSTGSGVGNILFSSTLDGAQNLTLATGNGNITFTGAVGSTTPIGTLTINTTNNVTANALQASVYNQTAGSGISTFNGAVSLTGASGFSFVGTNATFNNSLTTTNSGPVNVQVSGTLVLSSSAAFNLSGSFHQTGIGTAQIAGSITTANNLIQFNSAVVCSNAMVLNTGSGAGDINFSSTVDGPGALTLTAGTGSIDFSAAAGSLTRLGVLTINNANNVTTQAITAASINQAVEATGTSNFGGDLNTNSSAGISLNSTVLTVNGNLITTNAGPVTLNHNGLLTLTAGASSLISGNFTESGTGSVNYSGTLVANNANISFANPVNLTGAATLNSNVGAGSITFSSTIDGAQNLTLAVGTGNISLNGNVGSTTRLNNLSINSALNVTTQGIIAATLSQLNGTGTTTFNGAINTNAVGGVNLVGSAFTFNNTVTTTAAGPVSINNVGTLNLTSNAICSVAGAFTQTNTGSVTLAGQVTAGGAIALAGPVTLSGSAQLSTATASQNITIANTVDGGGNLTLAAGGGSIALESAVGGTTRIGALTIASALNVTSLDINAASINQQAGTGTTTVTGSLNTNAIAGITFALNNLTITGNFTTTNSGPVTITNSGTFTSVAGTTGSIDGAFLQNGTGPVVYFGTLQTDNQPIAFSSSITLNGDVTFNAGTTGGDITLSSTVNGAHALNLAASSGNILLSGIIGGTTPPTSLTFTSAHNITTQNSINANTISQTAGTGTSIFNGSLSASTPAGIALSGTSFQFNQPVTTTNAGVFTLTNSGTALFANTFTINGVFTQSGSGTVSLETTLNTQGTNLTIGSPITLLGDSTINTSGGQLTLSNTVDGAHALSLTAGTGDIVAANSIGSNTALASFSASANNVTLANVGTSNTAGVSGALTVTAVSDINFNGATYNASSQTYSAVLANITSVPLTTFTTNGNPIDFSAVPILIGVNANLTVNSANGDIKMGSIDATANDLSTVTLNSGSGSITLANVGTVGNGEIGSLSLSGGDIVLHGNIFTNAISFSTVNPHVISLGGDITTAGTSITFPSSVDIIRDNVNNATLTTGGGNITFQGNIDGDLAASRRLTLVSGAGNISFGGPVGSVASLDQLNIISANNVTTEAITANSITQVAGTGTTTFGGQVTTNTVNGLDLIGNQFTFSNGVNTTANNGVILINNSGTLTINSGVVWNLGGSLSQIGSGPVSLAVDISSIDSINIASPITLIGATVLNTSAGPKTITLQSTVDGGFDLSLNAGTSNVTIGGNIGATTRLGALTINPAANITVQSITSQSISLTGGSGTITINGHLNTNGASGITIVGTNLSTFGTVTTTGGGSITITNSGSFVGSSPLVFSIDGSVIQNGTGPVSFAGSVICNTGGVSVASAGTLLGATSFDTSGGGGNITFSSPLNGTFPLTLTAGAGNVLFSADLGDDQALGALLINSAANVTTQAITALSIQQLAGTGTTTFNGALSTTGATGISVNNASIVRGAAITTTNGGPCTLTISNSGTLTSTAAGAINISGGFSQTGTGTVTFGGTLNTSNNAISFAGPMTLAADSTFNSGAGGGNITFNSIQGAHAIAISGGIGNVTFNGNVGSTTPLTSVVINNAVNVTTQSITAGFIQQATATGISTFNGALSTTTSTGISLTGNAFAFNAPFTTTNSGTFTLSNSGLATMSSSATGSIAAAFLQNGSGTTQLSNAITSTAGTIGFNGPVTLSGTASLTTTNQAITLFNTLDSTASTPGSLTISAGTADFMIQGSAGSIHPLNALTLSTVRNVTTLGIVASSITQSAGSGTSTFNGNLVTTGIGGIHLTGSVITFLGSVTTSNGGPIAIVNAGTLTTTINQPLFGDGGVSQTGSGLVNLASNVSANNNNISFSSGITLGADLTLNAGTTAGNITVGTVDGGFDLTFTPGLDLTTGVIGGTARVNDVTITQVRNANFSAITSFSIQQLAGTGTTTFSGNLNTNTSLGINLTGNNFTRNGSITTTNGGSVTKTNTGLITENAINTTSIDGSYTQIGVGPSAAIDLAGSITARLGISLSSPVTLSSDSMNVTPVTLDTSTGNGNIIVGGTINNDAMSAHTLILRAGSGNVTLNGAVGNTTAIGPLILGNVNNLTAVAITADSIQQQMSATISGVAAFNGAIVTSGASGIDLSGFEIDFNSQVTTSNGGPVSVAVSNRLIVANGATLSLNGSFSQTGLGAVLWGGALTTANADITIASPVTLIGNSSLNSGSGSGNVTLSSPTDGAFSLSLAGGSGAVSFQGIGITTPLTSFSVNNAGSITANSSISVAGPLSLTTAGALTLTGAVVTTTAGGTIAFSNGGTLTIPSAITSSSSLIQTQTGTPTTHLSANLTTVGTLQLASNTTLLNNVTMNSGGGALSLAGTVDSDTTPRNLTLVAGSGNLTLSSAIGGTHPLATFQITNAANVTAANIAAASILQSAGTGLTHFTGTLSTTNVAGISLTGSQFTLDNPVTTTNIGPLAISHTGLLTMNALPAMGSHSLSGSFTESGGGAVSTAANITTANQIISFADAVTLTGNTTLTSTGGNITFSSSIDGPFCLTLAASGGVIELDGPIGSTTNLGCLTLSGATILQNSSITTTGAVQQTGAMTIGGNITTAASDITLTGNVTLAASGTTTFSTGSGSGDGTIHITGTVNPLLSTQNFICQTGTTGTATFDSSTGGVVPFHNFTVNAGTINLNNFGSTSPGATGTASLNAANNINFTGTSYNNGTQLYTAGSNFNFTSGSNTTITSAGSSITFATGTIQLSNNLNINSNGGNVTLTDLFGAGQTLNINAAAGGVTVAHIGTIAQPLNAINVTAAMLTAPFTTYPAINFTPTAFTLISTNQVDPTNYFSPVLITADNITFSFSSCPGGNNIIFESTLDSDGVGNSRNITFDMCGNTLTFNGTVGGTAPLTSITVNDDSGVSFNSLVTLGSYTQTTTRAGATTTFNSGIITVTNAGPTPTSGDVNITAPNITLAGEMNLAGSATITNSGTFSVGANIITAGAFDQAGTGGVTITGSVVAEDNPITFTGPITLNGSLVLTSVNNSGANITLGNTVNGNFNLNLTAGTGDITLSGNLGTSMNPLNNVVLTSARNVTAQSIFAATLTQLAGSGTSSFGSLSTNAVGGIQLTGTHFSSSTGVITTTNGGNLVLTNSGTISAGASFAVNVSGSLTQNGSNSSQISLSGTLAANTGISFVGPIVLTGDNVFDTSGSGGPLTLSNTVNGAHQLTLKAGTGNVTLSGALGGTTPLTALVLNNLNNLTASAISAGSISQAMASTITGTVTFNGALSTTGATGIVLAAPEFALNNNITTTGSGPLTLTDTTSLTFASGITLSLSGPFTESGGGAVLLAGSMTTTNQNISFADPVNLAGSTSLSSGSGAGNIVFSSTLDGNQPLTLTAGTGTITFGGNVGSTTALGSLTIQSVNGITYPSVSAASLTQVANSGTTTINGPLLTLASGGISLTGGAFTQNSTITTNSLGSFTITHSGAFTMAVGSGATISGSYTDSPSSVGTVSMRGTINAGGSIAFSGSGAITLAAATNLNSGVSNGSITFNPTVDGANNLTINANGDLVIFSSNVGLNTRLGTLTITSVSNLDMQKVAASSLSQQSGTGTSHFHDTVNVNGVSGISLIGSDFTFDNTVTASAGPVTIANSGTATFNSGANVSSAGNFDLNGTGPVSLANTITTTNGTIICTSNITLAGATSLNSSAGNQSITLNGTTNGANNFSLNSGSGNITLLDATGANTRVGSVSFTCSGSLLSHKIFASSITLAGSSAAQFDEDLNTNAVGGIHLTGSTIKLIGNATTTASGPIVITNSGLLTTSVNTTLSADGGFSQTGAGNVSLSSNVLANSNPISFASPITLGAGVLLNSLSSGSGGADITLDTVDGAFDLTFTAGSGNVTVGAIGGTTPLVSFTTTSVHNENLQNVTAATIQQLAGTGTTTITGTLTTTGPLGISLVGTNFTRMGNVITQNGGSLTVTNSGLITGSIGNTTSIDGSYIQNGSGATNFAGTITARQGISFLGPIFMIANGVMDASTGNGSITLSNTIDNIDSITPHSFTVNAGTGNVVLSSAVGANAPLSTLSLTGDAVSFANIGTSMAPGLTGALNIPAVASLITPSAIHFNGTQINAQAQNYTAVTNFNMNAGALTTFSSNGHAVTFTTGTLQLAASTDVTINTVSGTTGGNITTGDIHAGGNAQRNLVLNAGTGIASPGTIQLGTIGSSGNGEFASATLTGVLTLPNDIYANAITFNPTGAMTVGGNLTTVNSNLTFPTAVTLTGSKSFTTGGGNIVFSGTLNGDASGTRSPILSAGSGSITFNAAVGGTFPLNVLTVLGANNVSATAAGASISAGSILQLAGTGTTRFSNAVSTTLAAGLSFTGNSLQFDNTSTLTTTNAGSLVVNNAGTFTFAGTATLSGSLSQSGAGGVSLSGSVSAGQPVSFAGPVSLTGTPSIDTSANGQSITFSNTVNGPGALSLTAGTGDIAMSGTIGGSTPLGAVTMVSAHNITLQPLSAASLTFTNFTGTANYETITTTGAAGVNTAGNNFIRNGSLIIGGGGSLTVTNSGFVRGFATNTTMIDGSYIQNGTGPYDLSGSITVGANISLASAVTLTSTASLASTGNGTITLSNVVDGNQNLTLSVGNGTINFNGLVGNTDRVGTLTISSAGTVNTLGIQAGAIIQAAGSGTTTFSGNLNTNGSQGISLTGTHFVRGGNWTTTGDGPITITIPNGGSLISTAAGTINCAGTFRQLGSGSVTLSQTINTSSSDILFSGPVTLAGATTLNTGGIGPGNITFSSTLDGASTLNLTTGSSDILMQGAVGAGTRLGAITINTANNVTFQQLNAASLTQLNGSSTTTLNGSTNTNTAQGVSLITSAVTINGTLTTTNTGGVSIQNSGLFTLNANCSVAGNFNQNSTGTSLLSAAITSTGGQISFTGPVQASGTAQLTTSSQPIAFLNTVDGSTAGIGNLTLNSGNAGDITFSGNIGSNARLGNLLITNARNTSIKSITATALSQNAGVGTTSILGTINTSQAGGVNLIGSIFNINGSIITTNGGPMSVSHSGLLTLIAGNSTAISGPFTESGTGTVSMSGLLHTLSADITFTNPITLLNPTTLNSDGSGDILISNPVDGATDLILDSGTNNITVLAAIGGVTRINNLVITATNNASFQAINAQTITQDAGTGTTTFNGALSTSLLNGIQLTGNAFTFAAPVTTLNSGIVTIDNSGLLTIAAACSMNLAGAFSQTGTGGVALSGTITINNQAMSFMGPVTLGNTVSLSTSSATGSINFLNTVNGAQNLNLSTGIGTITFAQPVGGSVPLGALTVTSATTLTSTAITASSIHLSGITGAGTFNGNLSTQGSAGIVLSGLNFTFNQNVTTANAGPLTITNTGLVTFDPTGSVSIDGPVNLNGTGIISTGGTLTTNNQPVSFSSEVLLSNNYTINTGSVGNNVTFMSDLEGPFNLSVNAGVGTVTYQKSIGVGMPINQLTINAGNISLAGVGTIDSGITNQMTLTAANAINLNNSFYTAGTQSYTAGTNINFINGALTTMTALSGPISFSGAPVILSTNNDLSIVTNGGAFSYASLQGTTFENLQINTGTGTALMNSITGSHINNIGVNAGAIVLVNSINGVNVNFQSLGAIANQDGPGPVVTSTNTAFFNALGGDVGTLSSPIFVTTSNQIFAGADGRADSLADFNGSSVDNTVHPIPSNPPCEIIFNGVVIKQCNLPIPSGTVPSVQKVIAFPFAVPGFDSSFFNLASDYFFMPYFFDEEYVHRHIPMLYKKTSKHIWDFFKGRGGRSIGTRALSEPSIHFVSDQFDNWDHKVVGL
jgi:hypothetical protein